MKAFLKKIFILLVLCLPLIIAQYFICNKSDKYYSVVTHKSESLILGLSRAKANIVPHILQSELNLYQMPLNMALTMNHTPYGFNYFSFVKRKLKRSNRGIHILSVNPGGVMDIERDKYGKPRESNTIIYDLYTVNQPFNMEYLLRMRGYGNVIYNYLFTPDIRYHRNGWREYVLNGPRIPSENDPEAKFFMNKEREYYLEQIVSVLSDHGKVVLVRLPTSEFIRTHEQEKYPDFNIKMDALAEEYNAIFLDYDEFPSDLIFFDIPGDHFESKSAVRFTKLLAHDIKIKLNN